MEEHALTESDRQRGQFRLIGLAVTGSMNNALVTSISALFLLALGASPFQVGLLATVQHLERATRLVGLQLIPRLGKAGLMFWGRLTSLLPAIGLVALAFWSSSGTTIIWAGLALLGTRGLLQQTGNTAWWPLIQDNTHRNAVGAFMARLRTRQRALELVLPLLVGGYLGARPPGRDFALPFALALATTVLGAWFVRRVSERPLPPPTDGLMRRVLDAFRIPSIRRISVYMVGYNALRSASFPFWVVILTSQGMPVVYFVWMTSVMAMGQILGLTWWGRLVDRHGSRATLTISLVLAAAIGPVWLGLPAQTLWLTLWAGGLHAVWGVLEAGHQMGRTRAMMDAVPADYQTEGFSVIMYAASAGGILGGLGGGAAFQWASGYASGILGCDARQVYLTGVQAAFLIAWYLSTRLPGYREQTRVRTLVRRRWDKNAADDCG